MTKKRAKGRARTKGKEAPRVRGVSPGMRYPGGRPATDAQAYVLEDLKADGYRVLRTGYPTFIAESADQTSLRLIVVNGPAARVPLSPRQRAMARLLERHTGLKVEVWQVEPTDLGLPPDENPQLLNPWVRRGTRRPWNRAKG
ncbi:MAG TPA: hypothetical protein QF572_09070 [Vicinamibacterales bacterium]|nr:hypothetical protein [Vicinamibacterales bacterium]